MMSVAQIMTILYPVMAATAFTLSGMALLFWATRKRTWLVMIQAIYFLAEFCALTLLSLSTGSNPIFDIAQFRPMIVVARLLMLAAMWLYAHEYWRRVRSD